MSDIDRLIYPKKFRATDEFEDPGHHQHFSTLNLVKKNDYIDTNGDLYKVEYYVDYDEVLEQYVDLAIEETRVFFRSAITGLPTKRTTHIKWYDEDGNVQLEYDTKPKIYTQTKAIKANERARENLVDKAKETFSGMIIAGAGGNMTTAFANKNNFLEIAETKMALYKDSDIYPLLTLLDETVTVGHENERAYMNQTIVDALKLILDVTYTT